MSKQEERNVLAAFYGKNAFVKVKACLEIGKIQFSFVDMENCKKHIDCYMEAEEFGAILMTAIRNGSLQKALLTEKAKGEQYPKPVWTSPVGGNSSGNNGEPISRYFEISPASKGEVLFTAYLFPAEVNGTGAFIKKKGSSALLTLRIPCTFNDLKILAYKWSFLESDYMSKKYTADNMKSDNTSAVLPASPKSKQEPEKAPEPASTSQVKVVKLVATSKLVQVPGKNVKICKVELDGDEKRLVFLTDKISDLSKLASFEEQLSSRVDANKSLEFKASVSDKGNDLYLCKFA